MVLPDNKMEQIHKVLLDGAAVEEREEPV